jgi:hypothetical protein
MRMGLFVRLAVTTLVSALTAGCQFGGDAFKAEFTRSEELTGSVAGITMLDIRTDVGKIHLNAADVAEIRVHAEIKVKAATEERARKLAEGVRIVLEPSGETLAIKAVRPAGFGHNGVNFIVTAPAGLALKCTTNIGDIHTTGFTGRIEAFADIGDIRAEYAPDAPAVIHLDASANVGSIELIGPKDISAELIAEAHVGAIDTDRPLTVIGHMKESIRSSLGSAEGRISLRTNVGSIRIR